VNEYNFFIVLLLLISIFEGAHSKEPQKDTIASSLTGSLKSEPSAYGRVRFSDDQYVMYANGIILDKVNGLEFYFSESDVRGRFAAQKWVSSLYMNGGGWRLPLYDEVLGLYKRRQKSRVLLYSLNVPQKHIWYQESVTERFNFITGNTLMEDYGGPTPFAYTIAVRSHEIGKKLRLKTSVHKKKLQPEAVPNGSLKPQKIDYGRIRVSDDHYVMHANGIIIDKVKRLEFYFPEFDMIGREAAQQWTANLNLGGGNWRLAFYDEISGLYKKRYKSKVLRFNLDVPQKYVWYQESLTERFNFISGNTLIEDGEDSASFAYAIAVRPQRIDEKPRPKTQESAPVLTGSLKLEKPAYGRIESSDDQYVKYANGVIFDKVNGLEIYVRPYGMLGRYAAQEWATSIEKGGGKWRIAFYEEVVGLHKRRIKSNVLWLYLDLPQSYVWYQESLTDRFSFISGNTNIVGSVVNASFAHAIAVRPLEGYSKPKSKAMAQKKRIKPEVVPNGSIQLEKPEYGRIEISDGQYVKYANGIIFDKINGLEFYFHEFDMLGRFAAQKWAAGLNQGGWNWRLARYEELSWLYEKRNKSGVLRSNLSVPQRYIWYHESLRERFNFNQGNASRDEYGDNTSFAYAIAARPREIEMKFESEIKTHKRREKPKDFSAGPLKSKESAYGKIELSDDQYIKFANGIILDKENGLEFYFHESDILGRFAAQKWTSNLKKSGGDWRLALYDEVLRLYKKRITSKVLRLNLNVPRKYIWYQESFTTRFNFSTGNTFINDYGDNFPFAYTIAVRPKKTIPAPGN